MIRAMALHCDHPGCSRRILGMSGPRSRRSKGLRPKAIEEGWTRTEAGGDLCPDHGIERPIESNEGDWDDLEVKGE